MFNSHGAHVDHDPLQNEGSCCILINKYKIVFSFFNHLESKLNMLNASDNNIVFPL